MQYYLSEDNFKVALLKTDISRLNKILLILYWNNELPKSVSKIKEIGISYGLRECSKWNLSDLLAKANANATLIKGSWSLTILGKNSLFNLGLLKENNAPLKNDLADLRAKLVSISDLHIKSFLEEAIICLETDQKKAAVVFSWIGAIAILHDEIINNHLTVFNTEAFRRDSKWKTAKTADDLGRMKEADFLNVLESISVIGKNVKQELQNCLQLRNACGHPNSLSIGIRKVAAHIEILILNVFSKF